MAVANFVQEKKNQHFVPQCHSRGFAIEGEKNLIWEYDKEHIKISRTPMSIRKSVCCKKFYYEQRNPDGSKTQILEDAFNKIETPAIGIIRKLEEQKILSPEGKGTVAYYIALLLTRGPSFRDGYHSGCQNRVEITMQKSYETGTLPEPPEEIRNLIKNGDITSAVDIEIYPDVSIQPMLGAAYQIAKSLCNKKWDIYFTKGSYFVTSDTPVMFGGLSGDSDEVGPAYYYSLVRCPLTKNMTIVTRPYVTSDDSRYECKTAKMEMVEKINQLTCYAAQRYIYAPERSDRLLGYLSPAKGFSQSLKSCKFGDVVTLRWGTDKT